MADTPPMIIIRVRNLLSHRRHKPSDVVLDARLSLPLIEAACLAAVFAAYVEKYVR